MEPTQEYLAAPEVGRTRAEASHGATQVVVENYSDAAHVFGKSVVYLSADSGRTFAPIGWDVTWLSYWKKLGREWPPHDLYIERLDDQLLQVGYIEAAYDGPIDRRASYVFVKKSWRL